MENSVDFVSFRSNSSDRGFEKNVAQLTKSSVTTASFVLAQRHEAHIPGEAVVDSIS